jgi:hypothetical protein
MPLQDITITASINSLATHSYGQRTYIASSEEQSFPIETITGSYAGAWPNFRLRGLTSTNSASNTTEDLIVNITQSWPESIITPLGLITRTHNTMEEFINGEFSGSNYVVSNGNLTDEDCQELLTVSPFSPRYAIQSLPTGIRSASYIDGVFQGDQLTIFNLNNNSNPSPGRIIIYTTEDLQTDVPPSFIVKTITKIKINKEDFDGQDQTLSLQELTRISWIDSTIGIISLKVNNINEYSTGFIYDVTTTIYNLFGTSTPTWIDTVPNLGPFNTILEPYLISSFRNSDCDVLQNNAVINSTSNTHQRVLYDDGSIIPSNINQIISGTAEPANINDYLYNASDNIIPRYSGVRTTSAGFNKPSINGLSNESLSNIPYSNTLYVNANISNVELTTTYFAFFNGLKSNNPIFKNTTSPILKFLINEDGEVFSPSTNDSVYYNIINSFPKTSKIYTNLLYNNSLTFSTTQSVLLSGESYKPILYSLSASNNYSAIFSDKIDFVNLQNSTAGGGAGNINYQFEVFGGWNTPGFSAGLNPLLTSNILSEPYGFTNLSIVSYDSASGYDNTPPFGTDSPSYIFTGTPVTNVDIEFGFAPKTSGGTAIIKMELWLNRGAGDVLLDTLLITAINIASGFQTKHSKTYSNFFPQPGDKIWCTMTNLDQNSTIYFFNGSNPDYLSFNPYFKIIPLQVPLPSSMKPFWYTGSLSKNILTSSVALGTALQGNYKQVDIEFSGLDLIETPCQVFTQDEIRFEYDENFSYTINKVEAASSGGNPISYLYLDSNLPNNGIDINNFIIRRKVKDPITGIALDNNLISPINEGFLLPEYPSERLRKNLPKIIEDLTNRALI